MGNFDSGRPQIRQRVENTPSVCALQWCRDNGGEIVSRPMPDNREFEMGLCPRCKSARHELYIVEDDVACRDCHGLIYSSVSQRNSHAAQVRSDPNATGDALGAIQGYVETGDDKLYNQGMKTLSALDRLPSATAATDALSPGLADRIIASDLNDSSALLEILKAAILEGVEQTVNRRGQPVEIALRGDTLAKLSRAFVTVSAFRADRADQMLDLIAARATPEEHQNIVDQLREAMRAENYKFPLGHTLEELEAVRRGEPQGTNGAVE